MFGSVAGSDRTAEVLLEQYVAVVDDVDSLTHPSFSNWFTPDLIKFLRDILEDSVEALDQRTYQLEVRLARSTTTYPVVSLWNKSKERYHLYLTNIPVEEFEANEIDLTYRAYWEVEWTFRSFTSWCGLDEPQVSDPVIIEALILVATLSLVVSG